MVVVKRLDPEYPRLGYEVQKGLMVDMLAEMVKLRL